MFATLTRCKTAVHNFGLKLIEEKKQLLAKAEKCKARDFLTLFCGSIYTGLYMTSEYPCTVKANCQPDLPEDQRLSDQELLDIINTMLSAG